MEQTSANPGSLQLLLLAAALIPAILFLLTQQNTLRAIRPENRRMRSGLVWLQLIPYLGVVWQFIVVVKIAQSIALELQGWTEDSIIGFTDAEAVDASGRKPTLIMGIIFCSLQTFVMGSAVAATVDQVAYSNNFYALIGFVTIAMVVCWIIYWVNLAQYKRRLKQIVLGAV